MYFKRTLKWAFFPTIRSKAFWDGSLVYIQDKGSRSRNEWVKRGTRCKRNGLSDIISKENFYVENSRVLSRLKKAVSGTVDHKTTRFDLKKRIPKQSWRFLVGLDQTSRLLSRSFLENKKMEQKNSKSNDFFFLFYIFSMPFPSNY